MFFQKMTRPSVVAVKADIKVLCAGEIDQVSGGEDQGASKEMMDKLAKILQKTETTCNPTQCTIK